ncbi:MAG TPA: 2-amino-4-hydroxy-6-hydroxymethyldihydropteridine diphosphokinase [Gemmatimonadaceae bacterium]|nr:2-amino-4-hydroxy-6-hydroxymethyldihydropteridine diphosphokinase [Gemmatimonadaceae bacterium]
MPGDIAYIALGSNVGDRAEHLAGARAALDRLPECRVIRASSVEETAPVGPPQEPYLNQMVAVETTLAPRELLRALQGIEAAHGRERGVRWGPRTLDLDIVAFERARMDEPDLRVPHPELPNRAFWRRELAELRAAR